MLFWIDLLFSVSRFRDGIRTSLDNVLRRVLKNVYHYIHSIHQRYCLGRHKSFWIFLNSSILTFILLACKQLLEPFVYVIETNMLALFPVTALRHFYIRFSNIFFIIHLNFPFLHLRRGNNYLFSFVFRFLSTAFSFHFSRELLLRIPL